MESTGLEYVYSLTFKMAKKNSKTKTGSKALARKAATGHPITEVEKMAKDIELYIKEETQVTSLPVPTPPPTHHSNSPPPSETLSGHRTRRQRCETHSTLSALLSPLLSLLPTSSQPLPFPRTRHRGHEPGGDQPQLIEEVDSGGADQDEKELAVAMNLPLSCGSRQGSRAKDWLTVPPWSNTAKGMEELDENTARLSGGRTDEKELAVTTNLPLSCGSRQRSQVKDWSTVPGSTLHGEDGGGPDEKQREAGRRESGREGAGSRHELASFLRLAPKVTGKGLVDCAWIDTA